MKSTRWHYIGPGFGPKHRHSSLKPRATPILGDLSALFWPPGTPGIDVVHTNIHAGKKKSPYVLKRESMKLGVRRWVWEELREALGVDIKVYRIP